VGGWTGAGDVGVAGHASIRPHAFSAGAVAVLLLPWLHQAGQGSHDVLPCIPFGFRASRREQAGGIPGMKRSAPPRSPPPPRRTRGGGCGQRPRTTQCASSSSTRLGGSSLYRKRRRRLSAPSWASTVSRTGGSSSTHRHPAPHRHSACGGNLRVRRQCRTMLARDPKLLRSPHGDSSSSPRCRLDWSY
jgi:hypothetical protein